MCAHRDESFVRGYCNHHFQLEDISIEVPPIADKVVTDTDRGIGGSDTSTADDDHSAQDVEEIDSSHAEFVEDKVPINADRLRTKKNTPHEEDSGHDRDSVPAVTPTGSVPQEPSLLKEGRKTPTDEKPDGDRARPHSGSDGHHDPSPEREMTRSAARNEKTASLATDWDQAKLRTYVKPEQSTGDTEAGRNEAVRRSAVDRAGVDRVLDFETARGRTPVEMPHNNPGYDVESSNVQGGIERYIEIKSVSRSWGELGAALSDTQFHYARQLADRYWLYVVEHAQQDDFHIHRIQDPARKVNEFIFDSGWRVLGESDDKHSDIEELS